MNARDIFIRGDVVIYEGNVLRLVMMLARVFPFFLSRFNKITLENELSSVIKNHGENRNISIVNYRM